MSIIVMRSHAVVIVLSWELLFELTNGNYLS